MSAGMAGVIAAHAYAHSEIEDHPEHGFTDVAVCICGARLHLGMIGEPNDRDDLHAAHVAEELAKAGYGDVQEAKADALTDAANWLVNGEVAGIIAYDGPSNRGEVMAAYDAALEDPAGWLQERAEAALAVDPAGLYREAQDGMAEAWDEGFKQGGSMHDVNYDDPNAHTRNPYRDPLAAALADPEGHALVKAIHDRKAQASA